jgi:microcystin-dependent protein
MSQVDTFVGEIRMFGGSFAPEGWSFCNGQILTILQNEALFSLIGTTYGGDGRTTFALPDLRGRLPIHYGKGTNGMTAWPLGDSPGYEAVTLRTENLPAHSHTFNANDVSADNVALQEKVLAKTVEGDNFYSPGEEGKDVELVGGSIAQTGGNEAHYNLMPYLCINFIISMQGTYPQRP